MSCEQAKTIDYSYPVARKEYRCCECRLTINKGDKYERVTGLWDGGWETFTTCMTCSDQRNRITHNCKILVDAPAFMELREWLDECGQELDALLHNHGVTRCPPIRESTSHR